jgi:uncharacterized membrane protein YqjE
VTQNSGLLASVRVLLGTLLGMARTRLELIATELEEERLHLARLVMYGLLALFFFGLGVMVLSLLIIAAFWDTNRLAAITVLVVAYLAIALGFGLAARKQLRRKPRLFSATLVEIDKDRAALASSNE